MIEFLALLGASLFFAAVVWLASRMMPRDFRRELNGQSDGFKYTASYRGSW